MVYMTRNVRAISTVLIFTSTLNCYAQQIMQVNITATQYNYNTVQDADH